MIRKLSLAAAAMIMTVQSAHAQSVCITRPELRAGIRFLLPTLFSALNTKCNAALPATSYLQSRGKALAERFEAASDDPVLLSSLIGKIDDRLAGNADLDSMKPFFNAMVAQQVTKDLDTKLCAKIDEGLLLFDPLPAQNIVGLLELIAVEVDSDNRTKAVRRGNKPKTGICPATTPATN